MTTDPETTKALRMVRSITGRPIAVPFMGKVVDVSIADKRIDVVIDVFETTEGARDWTVTGHGVRMYSFTKGQNGWTPGKCLTLWDEDFAGEVVIGKTYKRVTPESFREAIDFARDCYRPGSSDQPLDSYQRVIDYANTSSATTPRMERHF